MEPNQTSDTSQLDPSIVALMHGLKTSEGTNGNYNATGDQGTAAGIGQWSNQPNGKITKLSQGQIPSDFQSQATQFGLNANDFSAANQNQVMYAQLEADKKSGLSPEQTLSKWNSGNPNAYQNPSTSTGTGPVGSYDVSAYVTKAMKAAQQYAQQNKSNGLGSFAQSIPSNLSQTPPQISNNPPQSQQNPGFLSNLMSGNLLGAGKDAANWAFPIIGDAVNDIQGNNQKSALQQLGDAGLSALWFVPGLGEEAGLGAKILEGGAIGYGAGSLNQLSQGNGLVSSLVPNASNLLGAATGGAAGGVLSKLSDFLGKNLTQEGAVNAVQDNLESAMNGSTSGANLLKDLKGVGNDPMGLAARENAIPDIVDGKFDSTGAKEVVQKNMSQIGSLRSAGLDSVGSTQSLDDMVASAKSKISTVPPNATPAEAKAIEQRSMSGETGKMSAKMDAIANDIKKNAGLKADENGVMPDMQLKPSQVESFKEAQTAASGIYKRTGQIGEQNASSLLGNEGRNSIEKMANDSGLPSIKELNKLMSQHYATLDALDKIDGQTVKGGRLGNLLRGHAIAGVSAIAANTMGGGILGILGAALGGEGANALLSKVLGETSFSNPIRDALLNRIETENPDIVSKIQEYLHNKGSLPAELQGKIGAQLAPKASGRMSGLISPILTKGSSRLISGLVSP